MVSRSVLLIVGAFLVVPFFQSGAQAIEGSLRKDIVFVSDTQSPMFIEKLYLKAHDNPRATRLLFEGINGQVPRCVFILGDVVAVGHQEKKWRAMDKYLAVLRTNRIPVFALLGNHDLMGNPMKGLDEFNKRFPEHVRTGYFQVVDSIAVVLLNSNFRTLASKDMETQQAFYTETLRLMDEDPAVKFTIVTCHHAPYSNSTLAGSSRQVQERFVGPFIQSKKGMLFITGHAHVFERFQVKGREFLTIGGGGGLHQPVGKGKPEWLNQAMDYNPEFHYLTVRQESNAMIVRSYRLSEDFSKVEQGYEFKVCCSDN